MELNEELQAIEDGLQGDVKKRILDTLILYGNAFGAKRMAKLTGQMGHSVIATGTITWKPVFELFQKLIDAGAKPQKPFTTDPVGYTPDVPASIPQRLMFKVIFSQQKRLEEEMREFGIVNDKAYTCTCYMPEVGNIPRRGEILAWAESSAVSYANSVCGARCNRNSGILEIMSEILGYVPEFGLLTNEGRKADYVVEIRTSKIPEPQVLGSAIGMKVIDRVPYIKGLDAWIGTDLDQKTKDYLKDMGAAAASNGSVGLYHVDHLTPEAKELGQSLIRENAEVFVVDDEVLQKTVDSYPNIWKHPDGRPQLAFAGCPHFSYEQLKEWSAALRAGLLKHQREKLAVKTIFTAAPQVVEHFNSADPKDAEFLKKIGVTVASICPLSYCANGRVKKVNVMTCSNKLRTYSHARFYLEETFIDVITGGEQA
jgi:predicted aconitase